jgi:retinol dehydrogenase 12
MSQKSLQGKVAIVTGANTGIGLVTAKELAKSGAHTFLACRSEEKTMPVVEQIKSETGNKQVEFLRLDLASLESVRACATAFRERDLPLHILINNAGVAGYSDLTEDGFELSFGVNHLGHFALTTELLSILKESSPARIVNVSSMSHYRAKAIDYSRLRSRASTVTGMPEYEVSKLANVLFTQELSRRLEGTGVTTYALHPGVIASDIWRHIPAILRGPFKLISKAFMLTVEEGAKTNLYCAMAPELENESGKYYDDCKERRANRVTLDENMAKELWARSAEWVDSNRHPANEPKEVLQSGSI